MRRIGATFRIIAEELLVTVDVARQVWNRYQKTSTYYTARRPGRSKILMECDTRHLKRYVTYDRETRRESLNEIITNLNFNSSSDTLYRTLKSLGIKYCIERKRPYLSKIQKATRLAFTKKYIHWTAEVWRHIIFTDEMDIQTGSNGKRVWMWRYPEETYKMDCYGVTHVSGFKKIKV